MPIKQVPLFCPVCKRRIEIPKSYLKMNIQGGGSIIINCGYCNKGEPEPMLDNKGNPIPPKNRSKASVKLKFTKIIEEKKDEEVKPNAECIIDNETSL